MLLFISKIVRIIKKEIFPTTCYAYQWLPYSLPHSCDCSDVCKFPPKGNNHIPITIYKTNINNINITI